MVFLKTPRPPRQFWARRQCHETTIHSVDAPGRVAGPVPRRGGHRITREIALDGIDELLTGFLTRSRVKLRSEGRPGLAITPHGAEQSWLVHVSDEPPVVERDSDERRRPGARGHRGGALPRAVEPDRRGQGKAYDFWRDTAQVSWS